MNVSNEFQEIGIFLAEDRLVAVLEKMAMPPVTQIKGDCIAGQKPAHQSGDRSSSGSQEEMKVIGEKRPSIAGGFCALEIGGEPFKKIVTVLIVEENAAPIDPSPDDVVKGSRGIDS